ncbi:MAG: cupin-like domain-containing protein [bacterium]
MDLRRVERIDPPSPEDFAAHYVKPSRPVILRGAAAGWPAMTRWSAAYFTARFGDRMVPALRTGGAALYDPQAGLTYDRIRFADYLALLEAKTPTELYVVFRVHEVMPELFDDIIRPPYCSDAGWARSRFWCAAPDTKGVFHRDLPENLYAQIIGRKRFLLLDRRLTRMVHRHSFFSGVPNYSPVDAAAPALAAHPRFRVAPLWSAEIEAGDLLFIPSLWWHQAHSFDTSVSINLWWVRGASVALAKAAELYMRVRKLRL